MSLRGVECAEGQGHAGAYCRGADDGISPRWLTIRAMSKRLPAWRSPARLWSAIPGGVIPGPPPRRPTSGARQWRSRWIWRRVMPWQTAFKACCTPRQDSWNWRNARSRRLSAWITGWDLRMGSPGYNAALLGRADETCRQSSGPCASIRRIGGTASGFSLAGFAELLLGRTENGDRAASEILGTQSQLWSRAAFLMAALSLIGRRSEAAETGGVIPQAISGLPDEYIRAAVVVAFGFFDLSCPDPSTFREDPHSRRGELKLADELVERSCPTARNLRAAQRAAAARQ